MTQGKEFRRSEMNVKIPIERIQWWRTREGDRIRITDMVDTHLLSSIHMIERNRQRDLEQVESRYAKFNFTDKEVYPRMLEHYGEYPLVYHAMVNEACKRGIIARNFELERDLEAVRKVADEQSSDYRALCIEFDRYKASHVQIVGRLHAEIENLKSPRRPLAIESLASLIGKAIEKKVQEKKNARKRPHSQGKKAKTRKGR